MSVKDKLDLSIGVAVGSSIQIGAASERDAELTLQRCSSFRCWSSSVRSECAAVADHPAWGMDKPLSLLFSPFESIVLFLAVLIVNVCGSGSVCADALQYTVQDARANWCARSRLLLADLFRLEGWLCAIVRSSALT